MSLGPGEEGRAWGGLVSSFRQQEPPLVYTWDKNLCVSGLMGKYFPEKPAKQWKKQDGEGTEAKQMEISSEVPDSAWFLGGSGA